MLKPLGDKAGTSIEGADAERLGAMTEAYLAQCKEGQYEQATASFKELNRTIDEILAKKKS